MRRAGGWRRCSWSGCGPRRRGRWQGRSGWTRARSGGGTRRWLRAGWPGWSRPGGAEGASKLIRQLAERIAGLDAAGATLREIAAATGVSTFSVRNALGRVASGRRPAAAGAAAGSAGRDAGDGEEGQGAAVPVLPDPVPARASGRWPGGGC